MTTIEKKPQTYHARMHGKIPLVDHIDKSYPLLLRDAIHDKMKAMPFFAGFNFTKNRMLQLQSNLLPLCGVYFLQETGNPLPEPQSVPTGFKTTVKLGISVVILNNDGEDADDKLDKAAQLISYKIYPDPILRNGLGKVNVQSFTSMSREHRFGATGQNNETPFAELRLELTADLGEVFYETQVHDMLETIHVTTQYPYGNDGAPQIISEYDLDQDQ